MSSDDWNEIKRLAADFQRAQLTTLIQKLSERNCVEIISKLLEQQLLEVVFTTDGKEFITPAQLVKEIKDELYMHSGRLNLTDLCTLLNVDLSVLESRAINLAKQDKDIHHVVGELISEDYLDGLAEEINEKLHLNGSITVGDVAKAYDLPGDFAHKVILSRLGKIIKGQQEESDPGTIFTDNFVARHKYQIRGILAAITRPTSLASIISSFDFQEKLFFTITEKLISSSVLEGFISGSKSTTQAVYVPAVYSKAQYEWVNSFLKQNGYLEFEALQKLNISDPAAYIKRYFPDHNLTFLPGACVGQLLIDQIDANLEEALVNGEFVDLAPYFPSSFTNEDCQSLIREALDIRERNAKSSRCSNIESEIFCDTIVFSDVLLTKMSLKLEELMPSKAEEAISKGAFKHQLSSGKSRQESEDVASKHKKDDRRKKAVGGKAGGGTQGRETKTKSTKNKHKGRKYATQGDSDEEINDTHKSNQVEFLSIDELVQELRRYPTLDDCIDELFEEVARHLYPNLTRKFQDVAREMLAATMCGGVDNRKKVHQTLQEKVSLLLTTTRLADKGLKEFGDDLQLLLSKYLLKTHCTDIFNEILLYLANDLQIDIKNKDLSNEIRLKVIDQIDADFKQALTAANKSLIATNLDSFLASIEDATAIVDILIKKKDHKKDKQFLMSHRSGLVDQLNVSLNSAVTMHLSCLILFQSLSGKLLHASGKFVPQILAYLKPLLSSDLYDVMYEYQHLVMKSLTMKEDCEQQSTVNSRIEELSPKVKELVINFKKPKKDNSISED